MCYNASDFGYIDNVMVILIRRSNVTSPFWANMNE